MLTNYNGTPITYDGVGNPLQWWNATELSWEKRELQKVTFSANSYAQYEYNSDGIRIGKSYINPSKYYCEERDIVLDGTKIIKEHIYVSTITSTTNTDVYYIYDDSGSVIGMHYNGAPYYFQKNLQGDVIRIVNSIGEVVVEYTYDAWGKVLTTTGSLASTVGKYNPFRYRSYYYDTETGYYYLQSRYYDPTVGRFLNADVFIGTGQGFVGFNMFAYCGNNPVNRVDYTGQFWSEIWEFAKTTVAEIGKAMGLMSPAYAGCGGAAVADGPLPFGDIAAAAGAALLTVGAIGYGIYQATQAPAVSIPKVEEKSEAIVVPKEPDSSVIFPVDPNTFNPVGLVRVRRTGTKNGAFISWMDPLTNIEVFRWDENSNYPNGPHYHINNPIYRKANVHFYPGDVVPKSYATIYFPFG